MKLTWKYIYTAAILTLATSSGQVNSDPHSDGLELGKNNLNNLSSKVSNSNAQTMPHYTNSPPQSQNFGSSDLFSVGVTRINTCKTEPHGTDQIANQECDAVNFLAKNPEQRTKFPIDQNDPIISGIGNTINNANEGSATEVCGTKTTTTPDVYATEVCNEYNLSEPKTCSMGQVVNVDAKANFQCNVTSNALENINCEKYLVMNCPANPTFCNAGGITPGSVQMSTGSAGITFSAPYLDVIHYINTEGYRETSTFTFNVTDINKLGVFKLVYAQYDNWLGLRINGRWVRVFMGGLDEAQSWATSKLDIVSAWWGSYVDIGNGASYGIEPDYPWGGIYSGSFDIDLKSYLKDGTNTIDFIIINGTAQGVGEAKFEIREFCTPCTETWVDQCSSLYNRTL
ncbi:hypothetical protein K5D56_21875 [Pseudomonas cichorii]|nr:hypothetical protein [Pseudomonas cichorii]MBX8557120.1 hypothetical protein [Pseudomonas cichorii]MBX8592019.1 hypothetical protein [Pseudomonas cichorii]